MWTLIIMCKIQNVDSEWAQFDLLNAQLFKNLQVLQIDVEKGHILITWSHVSIIVALYE